MSQVVLLSLWEVYISHKRWWWSWQELLWGDTVALIEICMCKFECNLGHYLEIRANWCMKITCYLDTWKDHHCYGYVINCSFVQIGSTLRLQCLWPLASDLHSVCLNVCLLLFTQPRNHQGGLKQFYCCFISFLTISITHVCLVGAMYEGLAFQRGNCGVSIMRSGK